MGLLLDRLRRQRLLVADGAWGTALQNRGLPLGQIPDAWNLSHPEEVRAVAAGYAEVGADLVQTNTFGCSQINLERYGIADQAAALNAAGVRLSYEGIQQAILRSPEVGMPPPLIMASIGPTGEFLEPYGTRTEAEIEAVYVAQCQALLADRQIPLAAFCIETMSSIEEALCAVRAARLVAPPLDIICTFTFLPSPQGFRTLMGVSPAQAAQALTAAGVEVIGANCGNGLEEMIPLVRELRANSGLPILVQANAGLPEIRGERAVYPRLPEEFAGQVPGIIKAGANMIGGCCGTTPAHVAAIRRAVAGYLEQNGLPGNDPRRRGV